MVKRSFVVAACGALSLLLTAVQACSAQIIFAPFWGGYPVGPTYWNYPRPFINSMPPTRLSSAMAYTAAEPITLYYGSAAFTPSYPYSSYTTARLVSPPAAAGVSSAAYTAPAYPVQSPNYNMIYPISPPVSALADNTARIEVRVPDGAEVYFEGQKTQQTGNERVYRSPPLRPGEVYVYEIRARWNADGKPMDVTRKVTVHAGDDDDVVDFTHSNSK